MVAQSHHANDGGSNRFSREEPSRRHGNRTPLKCGGEEDHAESTEECHCPRRRIEQEVVCEALRDHDGILSLGGGAITTAAVREALAGHIVVYLEIGAAEGIRRTGGSTVRPLLAGPDRAEKFRELMSQRAPLYRQVATIRINTNRRNPGAVVRYIVGRLEDPQPPRRRPAPRAALAGGWGCRGGR